MSAADALIARLPRITLVVGKGGVGKTTTSAALALHASRLVGRTLVLSTDPARALPAVLDAPIGPDPAPVSYAPRLFAQSLDAESLRSAFMARWGGVIRSILDRGTYLDDSDIAPLVDTALPGGDEIFSALALAQLVTEPWASRFERIVVDTAPTGHTLRLLQLPRTFRALLRVLDSMQAKHRFMVRTLTRTYHADDADAFLTEMATLVSALEDALHDPLRTAAVMVTNAQTMVVEETMRFCAALTALGVHVQAVIWNGEVPPAPIGAVEQLTVPRLDGWPTGHAGLQRWIESMRQAPAKRAAAAKAKGDTTARSSSARTTSTPARKKSAAAGVASLTQPLTIVAGKGGVGKTTVASALATRAADTRRTLIVSTDPAPSLADAFGQPIPDADTPIAGMPNLFARQMDATAAFARLRDEYQSRMDALFEGLVSSGVDLVHDRVVARDLLALAPPGMDEVYALSLLAEAVFTEHYGRVIVDPAPTGHLLRLLEMPQLALTWTHQILRLMLKYKDVTGLGDTAQELLEFARNLRAVDALLRDAARCGVVIVTLDEPVVRAETERLAHEVPRRGVALIGVVLNRSAAPGTATLPVPDAPMHFDAPAVNPPPMGSAALRVWSDSWISRGPRRGDAAANAEPPTHDQNT